MKEEGGDGIVDGIDSKLRVRGLALLPRVSTLKTKAVLA